MKINKINKYLKQFQNNGFVELNELLDKKKCKSLYRKIINNRKWDSTLFDSEKNFLKKKQFKKTNPGKGKSNLAESYNLDFIEKNNIIKKMLNNILGPHYEIILKKFVVGSPAEWIPKWLKKKIEKNLAANLGPYIKKKYRDVTYFRGIDYHMDQIDFPNNKSDFVTLYIYLNDTNLKMSPLNIVQKSHIFGSTKFPHIIKKTSNKNYVKYGANKNKLKKFRTKVLMGKSGTAYIWTCLTLHGTKPHDKNDQFRISLRYLIKKSKKNKKDFLLDKLLNTKVNVGKVRNDVDKNYIQKKFVKILK